MTEKKDSAVLKWVLIGCGGVVLIGGLAVAGCAYFVKRKFDSAKSEFEKTPEGRLAMKAMKEGARRGEGGVTGALTGLAGASIGMSSGALAAQVLPSLTKPEQEEAQMVFKALAEKGPRMQKEDFEAYSAAVKRFMDATEPRRKATQDAMKNETDPAKMSALAAEMIKVEPEYARRLVADLKAITDRL